jgi:hypothetical protein
MLMLAALAATMVAAAPPHGARPPIRSADVVWLPQPAEGHECHWGKGITAPADATVVLVCRITGQGTLEGCRAASPVANPDDLDCALKLADGMRMSLKTKSGQSVAGRVISFPMRFKAQ